MNDLKALMRENVAAPPPEHLDVDVAGGRRAPPGPRPAHSGRRRRRLLVAGVVAVAAITLAAGHRPRRNGRPSGRRRTRPRSSLADAAQGVEGRDYEVLTTYTNEDLDADNGQYLDGVTDDGLVLFRDGPRGGPAPPPVRPAGPRDRRGTGCRTCRWAGAHLAGRARRRAAGAAQPPAAAAGRAPRLRVRPRHAGVEHRAVAGPAAASSCLGAPAGTGRPALRARAGHPGSASRGRLADQAGGDAEDADAEGDTYRLWSVSLTDGPTSATRS